jgi:hypothetical protein
MSADWFGSGQGLRPEPFSGPTLTPPDTNGHDSLVSFADYGGHRWLDELVESDLTGDSLLRTTALAEDGGFETVTWRDERPSTWRRTFPSSRRPTRRR